MPLRRAAPVTFTGRGLSDTLDGTAATRGAMRTLTNMVRHPTTPGAWACRPGAVDLIDFTAAGFANPGFISGYEVIGDVAYGLIATSLNAGHDEPWAYNLATNAFLPVAGITNGNTPTSPATTGQWTPPQLKQAGQRIIATHTGFPGDDVKFGWFDISDFDARIEVDYTSGLPFLFGGFSLLGIQPGMRVTGSPDIPGGAVVKNVFPNTQSVFDFTASSNGSDILILANPVADIVEAYPGKRVTGPGVQDGTTMIGTPTGSTIQLSQPTTTSTAAGTFRLIGNIPAVSPYAYNGNMTAGDKFITNVGPSTDLHTGQQIVSSNALPGTYVSNIAGTTVNLTQPLIGGTGATYDFSAVGVVIELSAAPAATATGPLAITGGSADAPLWGAGDTAINALPSVPVGIAQMNGRAWFADGLDGIPFSDSLLACVRTNATQALLPNNGLPVTAIGPLMLQTPITGGIVIAIIAFQDASAMQQIQGDPATSNLSMNPLPVQTGTFAPNSISPSSKGLFFVSPEGLRLIDFQANVSDPIGQDGDGIVQPFLNVANPPQTSAACASRIAACAGGRTLRIDAPLTDGTTTSYWFDLSRRIWTGPHTGAASLCRTWRGWMLLAPYTRTAILQQASDDPRPDSVYVENGLPLDYEWETALLPDSGEMAENTIIESAIMTALPPGEQFQVNFLDEVRGILDGVALAGLDIPEAIWGQAIFGVTFLGPDSGAIRQRQLPWTVPLVFKQGSVNIRGLASAGIVLGNFYMRYQILGYLLEVPQIPAAPGADDSYLLANDGVTILQSNATFTNLRPN